jgi:cation transport protein ChaC
VAWVFGYGSIIWRPTFSYVSARPAQVCGWQRRFWQGSPDHRGTPLRPGRVVTLVEDADANCWGVAFDIGNQNSQDIFGALDSRESGGYVRMSIEVEFSDATCASAVTYYAPPGNDNYLGPAPIAQIASQVRDCSGNSGHNVEYVLRLGEALREIDIRDEEVEALDFAVRQLVENQ